MNTDCRLFAIDLDGTLVDSAPDLTHCLGSALAGLGFERPSESLTRRWIGDGIDTLIRRALEHSMDDEPPETTIRAVLARFDDCYRQNLFKRSRVYPGVTSTLEALRSRGRQLCCITNKRVAYACALLEQAGIRDYFRLVYGGDSLEQKKPHPGQLLAACEHFSISPDTALMVGDSTHDFDAAAAAGFSFVWAAYGYRSLLDRPLERIRVIHEFSELRDAGNPG